MDTRIVDKDSLDQKYQQDENQNYLIPIEKIQEEKAFKEALIFNIVKKLDSMNGMKRTYDEQLLEKETWPSFLKYYIHTPCNN